MTPDINTIALQCIGQAVVAQTAYIGWSEESLAEHAEVIGRALRAGLNAFTAESPAPKNISIPSFFDPEDAGAWLANHHPRQAGPDAPEAAVSKR